MASARLLLVDDDDSVLSGLGVVFQAHGFEVTTAPGVNEALKLIAAEPFDALLTDLHMPGAGDGLIVAGAMRHANPQAVTVVLSANPDMERALAAVRAGVDEVVTKPVRAGAIVETIQRRMAGDATPSEQVPEGSQEGSEAPPPPPRVRGVELVATMIERERAEITQVWLAKMAEAGTLASIPLSPADQSGHLRELLGEIVYRLQYPQPLGLMTLFSMASLQHGARRRRQGFRSPVLVEEARALQVALFQAILHHAGQMDLSQLPATLMAIADEVNAQLLQSLSGYENEKPVEFAADSR